MKDLSYLEYFVEKGWRRQVSHNSSLLGKTEGQHTQEAPDIRHNIHTHCFQWDALDAALKRLKHYFQFFSCLNPNLMDVIWLWPQTGVCSMSAEHSIRPPSSVSTRTAVWLYTCIISRICWWVLGITFVLDLWGFYFIISDKAWFVKHSPGVDEMKLSFVYLACDCCLLSHSCNSDW